MRNLIKLSVEHSYRTNEGWTCEVVTSDEQSHDRTVTEAELLAHLETDKYGRIRVSTEYCDVLGEPVEREQFLALDEWINEVGSSDLEYALQEIINLRENRTERLNRPLGQLADVGALIVRTATEAALESGRVSAQVDNLINSIPQIKRANAA